MKRQFLFCLTCLLLFAGCRQLTLCNGTGERVIFEIEGANADLTPFQNATVVVDPCSCESLFVITGTARIDVKDVNGGLIGNEDYFDIEFGKNTVATYDGFDLKRSIDKVPDLADKRTIQLCNESQEAIRVYPIHIESPTDVWLIEPGQCKTFSTVRKGEVTFEEDSSSATCTFELADGVKVVWDGVELTCDDDGGGGPPASVQLLNNSPDVDDFVALVLEGQLPTDLDFIDPGNFRFVDYPTGSSLTFQAYGLDLQLRDECILNNPSDGDQVIWNGATLECIDN